MAKHCKQERKIDGRTHRRSEARRSCGYEAQNRSAFTGDTVLDRARCCDRDPLEGIEADQIAGKPSTPKSTAPGGARSRVYSIRLGLTVRLACQRFRLPPFDCGQVSARERGQLAQEKAISEGWSDTERDRYAEELWQEYMKAA